jgi:hypothetical protein
MAFAALARSFSSCDMTSLLVLCSSGLSNRCQAITTRTQLSEVNHYSIGYLYKGMCQTAAKNISMNLKRPNTFNPHKYIIPLGNNPRMKKLRNSPKNV